jgi:hypothetical protein
MQTFEYLYMQPNRDLSKVLSETYKSMQSIAGKLITLGEIGHYTVFPSHAAFVTHLEQLPESNRIFHEVICNKMHQKLKFDIDAKISDLTNTAINDSFTLNSEFLGAPIKFYFEEEMKGNPIHKFQFVFQNIIESIKVLFYSKWGKSLEDRDFLICSSHCAGVKYSVHIIIKNYFVKDTQEAAQFTKELTELINPVCDPFLDKSVNKSTQNFRIALCHKSSADRRVMEILTNDSVLDSLVTWVHGCEELPSIHVATKSRTEGQPTGIGASKIAVIVAATLAHKEFADCHTFRNEVGGSLLIFDRIKPSECSLCERLHEHDNTLIVSISGHQAFAMCRRYNYDHPASKKSFVVYTEGKNPQPEDDQSLAKRMKANLKIDSLFDKLPATSQNVYDAAEMQPFKLASVLVVKAAMKMGKTKAIKDYINTYFGRPAEVKGGSPPLVEPIIRFLSFRQTFSNNVSANFPDFTLYSATQGRLNQARIILQIESLHRLDINEAPDLLILDECESIIAQLCAPTLYNSKNFALCFAAFEYLVRYSKHILCLDAYVSDRTYGVLGKMREGFASEVFFHNNTHNNAEDDEFILTMNKPKWQVLLDKSVAEGSHIVIPTSSLAEAKILHVYLSAKFKDKCIGIYTSKTNGLVKAEHLSNVNKYWENLDILIYTPTISAGVSFEKIHFDKLFGFFTDNSCDADTCMQMIGRVRDIKCKQYFICLQTFGGNYPTTTEQIRKNLNANRTSLFTKYGMFGLAPEYTNKAELKYHDTNYFAIWLENLRVRNLSRNDFMGRFVSLSSMYGAKISWLSEKYFEKLTGAKIETTAKVIEKAKADRSEARDFVKGTDVKRIAEAKDITQEEYTNILAKMNARIEIAQDNVTEDELASLGKYRLAQCFATYKGTIDGEFVRNYYSEKVMQNYENLTVYMKYFTGGPTEIETLQSTERDLHTFIMGGCNEYKYIDLYKKYGFNKHRLCHGVIQLLGWHNLFDDNYIGELTVANTIKANSQLLRGIVAEMYAELGTDPPTSSDLLKQINKIICQVYGARIRAEDGKLHIKLSDLFTLNVGDAGKWPVISQNTN